MRKVKGFYYDDKQMNGWQLGGPPKDGKLHWVLTDDKHRCIRAANGILMKWSLIGERCLMWHPQEVNDSDFMEYSPPAMPNGIEVVREDAV